MSVIEAVPSAMTVSLVLIERQGPWVRRLAGWSLPGARIEEAGGYSSWKLASDQGRDRDLDDHLGRLWKVLEKHQDELPVSKAPGLQWQLAVVLWFDGGAGARSVRTTVSSQNMAILARFGASLSFDTFLDYFPG